MARQESTTMSRPIVPSDIAQGATEDGTRYSCTFDGLDARRILHFDVLSSAHACASTTTSDGAKAR